MDQFPYHTPETAPAAARDLLQAAKRDFGMVPNLYAKMAEAPALLQAYLQLSDLFARSSLGPVERQVVLLTASRVNGCGYCVGAHSVLAGVAGVAPDVTDAIREDQPIQDPRLEALRKFTAAMVEKRGRLSTEELESFLDAGFSRCNLLDVILGVGQKILSNYTNHVAETALDSVFLHRAWQSPS
jgi:uncharacterized peroxidase-related enzyme